MINHVARLGSVRVGGGNPVRIMGVLNVSRESFYRGSVHTTKARIRDAVSRMEGQGADFVDVGGMSTAPYLSTMVSEELESKRVLDAVRVIQDASNLPISVDTCRAGVARDALERGVEIVNDVSGLKYDDGMADVVLEHAPDLVLCAHGTGTSSGSVSATRRLLQASLNIAERSGVPPDRIVLDPAIGFFRKGGRGPFFTRIRSDWVRRDISIISNLDRIGGDHPVLVSVSNKSFLGEILGEKDPSRRLFGSVAAEAISVMNGADVIRTHNVEAAGQAIAVSRRLSGRAAGPGR